MPVPHDLLADLNITADDFQARIDDNHDLHKLHKEYNAKDKEVLAAESNASTDDTVTRLRKERLAIKDRIKGIVDQHKA